MRTDLIVASRKHFEAHIEKHRMNIEVMLNNPTSIPGHPDVMDAIEKELEEMANYSDKLEMLNTYFKVG
jgi:LmbE family N-acetylglucosaminyl deacetylase